LAAAPETASAGDKYAAARANIRDTVKWLVAMFAGIAGVIVAGSPFTGFGSIPIGSERFWIALVALLAAFGFTALALYRTLMLLRADAMYPSELRASDKPEFRKVRDEINAHSVDLLPPNYPTLQALMDAKTQEQQALIAAQEEDEDEDEENATEVGEHADNAAEDDDEEQDEDEMAHLRELIARLDVVVSFASYLRYYNRLMTEVPRLFGLATAALLSLGAFAWAAAKQEPKAPAPPVTVQCCPAPTVPDNTKAAEAPYFPAVLFDSGRATVTPQHVETIARARDFLRTNADAVLLLKAHTDTVASARINRDLARRRAEAVRGLVLEPGGVAANRVFVAELPKQDVPELTRDETAELRNRSVELVVIRGAQR
jgi:outer membrane protein OmpA-like peptidoglycan-associated protein